MVEVVLKYRTMEYRCVKLNGNPWCHAFKVGQIYKAKENHHIVSDTEIVLLQGSSEWQVETECFEVVPANKVLDEQVGGDHYKNLAIQPVNYITKNGLGYLEGNIIKYVTRHKHKNGLEDLLKAKHYLEMAINNYERD